MIRNDPRTRNEIRTTGTRTGRARGHPSFGLPSQPFGAPSPNTVGRSDCIPVVPSNEDLVSFLLVRKWNDPATRDIFVFGSFHREKSVMSLGMKRHRNDNETTLGWYWSDCKTMQECIVLNVLGPAISIQSRSALFLFLFQPKLSLFCKSPGFSPRWGPLSLSPSQFVQLCWATLYSSDHQASRNLFSGPFRTPAQTFSFFSPHYISLCLQNQAPKKCQVSQGSRSLTTGKIYKFRNVHCRKWKLSNETNCVSPPK